MFRTGNSGELGFLAPVNVFGVKVNRLRAEEALVRIRRFLEGGQAARIFFVYAHSLNLACGDPEFRAVLNRADLVLNDGLGLEIAGVVLGRPFPENLCGTDFLPRVLRLARDLRKSIYLLGGRMEVVETCSQKLRQELPGITIAGFHSGYFSDNSMILSSIRRAQPDLLLVGMGVPRQEKWIDRWVESLSVRVAIGVGAFFDFYSGAVPRAPLWLRRMRMEWLFRLGLEPGRMWRRYILGNPAFILRLIRFRFLEGKK